MKTTVVKRSIVIRGHKTSVSLEDAFWAGIKKIAADRNTTVSDLVADIAEKRDCGNLSSCLRLTVLEHYRARAHPAPEGEQDHRGDREEPQAA
jgi:predicted DNA-binding ribbon-helix-helix protein